MVCCKINLCNKPSIVGLIRAISLYFILLLNAVYAYSLVRILIGLFPKDIL